MIHINVYVVYEHSFILISHLRSFKMSVTKEFHITLGILIILQICQIETKSIKSNSITINDKLNEGKNISGEVSIGERKSRQMDDFVVYPRRRLNNQYNIFHINYDGQNRDQPNMPYPPYPYQRPGYPDPYPYPPYPPYPPFSSTTTTTTTPGPPKPIGYMLVDTYHNRGFSHSRPIAYFTTG